MKKKDLSAVLTWEEFQTHIGADVPFNYRLDPAKPLFLRTDPKVGGIILDIELESTESFPDLSHYEEMDSRLIHERGSRVLRVSVVNGLIYREFFSFSESVADLIKEKNISPLEAFLSTLKNFPLLFEKSRGLDRRVVIGLFGELQFLRMLMVELGPVAVNAWTGPEDIVHDFRCDDWEIEIKTTTSERRRHMISSIDQLKPSQGKNLYFVSIQITKSPGIMGLSTIDLIKICRSLLAGTDSLKDFDDKVARLVSKKEEEESQLLRHKYSLRTKPRIVPVDVQFPRITTDDMKSYMGPDAISRVLKATYEIEVKSMGEYIEEGQILTFIQS